MAVRKRRIIVRTRVRLARFTSARWRDCAARFKTDFFFFLTLVACPWAIYCSFCVSLKLLTLNEVSGFVKQAEGRVVGYFGFGTSRSEGISTPSHPCDGCWCHWPLVGSQRLGYAVGRVGTGVKKSGVNENVA